MFTETPSAPLELVSIDIVGPLPATNVNKYTVILSLIDHFTGYIEFYPLVDQKATTVAKVLIKEFVSWFGIMRRLLTDGGSNFTSDVIKELCKLLGVKKVSTTPYQPQTNVLLERRHKVLAEYLRHYANSDQTDWDEWLPLARACLNILPKTSSNYSPFELMFGRSFEMARTLMQPPTLHYTEEDYIQELKTRMRTTWQLARNNILKKKIKRVDKANETKNFPKFKVGDLVLLHDPTVKRGRSKKLDSQYIGPYKITNRTGPVNFEIKRGRKTQNVHADRLKPFCER